MKYTLEKGQGFPLSHPPIAWNDIFILSVSCFVFVEDPGAQGKSSNAKHQKKKAATSPVREGKKGDLQLHLETLIWGKWLEGLVISYS